MAEDMTAIDTEQQAKIFVALSDPTRLKIVEILADCKEMGSSELADRLGISMALFCHHTKTMIEAGLVKKRRVGLVKYNSLDRTLLTHCLAHLIKLVAKEGEL